MLRGSYSWSSTCQRPTGGDPRGQRLSGARAALSGTLNRLARRVRVAAFVIRITGPAKAGHYAHPEARLKPSTTYRQWLALERYAAAHGRGAE